MADKTFHSIKFPGLPDTYKIPDIVNEYSTSSAYAIGDYVLKDGKTYKCATAIASSGEAWNTAHWTEVKVGNDLQREVIDLKSALGLFSYSDLYTTIPSTDTVLFRSSDVNVGDSIKYEITMPTNQGTYNESGFIGLFDSQDNRLAWYGRGYTSDQTTVFNGTFEIPNGFSYAQWKGLKLPIHLYIGKGEAGSSTPPFVSYRQNQTLSDEQKITARTNIGVEHVPEMYDFLEDVINISTGEVNCSKYPVQSGWLNGDHTWNMWNNLTHIVIPVVAGEEIYMDAGSNNRYIAFFNTYSSPVVKDATADVVPGGGRQYIPMNTTATITVPAGAHYLYLGLASGSVSSTYPTHLVIHSAASSKTLTDVINDEISGNGITGISFSSPITILSNKDSEATEYEQGYVTGGNIIQLSDSMYYLYYGGYAQLVDARDYPYRLCTLFAYSTDGIHYTRGFPQGITPPYPGTNKIINSDQNISFNVMVKCCDPKYPYRLICQELEGQYHRMNMYKSVDGINIDFSKKRRLRPEYHDTQTAVICRGDVLKMYFRENEHPVISGVEHHNRKLSVMYFDLDGNLLSPRKDLPLDYIYNSAATAINDVEEIILPTYFDGVVSQSFHVDAYKVNKYNVSPIDSNFDNILVSNDKWVLIQPGLITIDGEQYIMYRSNNKEHDHVFDEDPSTFESVLKIAKITMSL